MDKSKKSLKFNDNSVNNSSSDSIHIETNDLGVDEEDEDDEENNNHDSSNVKVIFS